jgi:SEC-C motif domain protein
VPKPAEAALPRESLAGACPCGRQDSRGRALALAQCCGRFIGRLDTCPAPDAQSLMRSRYSAFVLGDEAYLLATWLPRTRPPHVAFEPAAKWLGLEVRGARDLDEGHAEVEFIARLRVGGRAVRQHELSRFVREDGRWYYVDGDIQ